MNISVVKAKRYLVYTLCFFYIIVHSINCASFQITKGTFLPIHKQYTINTPKEGWEIIRLSGEDITLQHKKYQAMITIISSDLKNKEIPHESLDEHLFIGIKKKNIILKEEVLIDGEEAIHTILEFEADGQRLKMDSYIVNTGSKVYDLVYWATPDAYAYGQSDFNEVVKSFKLLEKRQE